MLGLLVADGSYFTSEQIRIAVATHEWDDISSLLPTWLQYRVETIDEVKCLDVSIRNTILTRVLHSLGFTGKRQYKQVGSIVGSLPEHLICSFLKGYFTGDGCVGKEGGVDVGTISKDIQQSVSSLLFQVGITHRVRAHHEPPNNIVYTISFKSLGYEVFKQKVGFAQQTKQIALLSYNKYDGRQSPYNIPLGDALYQRVKEIKKLGKFAGFYTEGHSRVTQEKLKQFGVQSSLLDAEILVSRVVSIKEQPIELTVYDLEVAENNNFVTEVGILVHNSGYPDNCVPFVETLNRIIPYSSNWQTRLRVSAPFVGLMKSEILEIGLKIGVPFERVCSCYYPTMTDDGYPKYCGNCGCETLYSYAWQKLGLRPPNFGFEGLEGHLRYPELPGTDPELRVSLETIPYHYVIKETI